MHMASCIAHQLTRLTPFRRLRHNEQLRRQVLAAACAAGVSATFGAPVGGVLFSIEVTASYYSIAHLWKAMFTSVCGALVFKISRNYGSLKLFDLTDFAEQDLGDLFFNGEMTAFAVLGLLCGLLGAPLCTRLHPRAPDSQLRVIVEGSGPPRRPQHRTAGAGPGSASSTTPLPATPAPGPGQGMAHLSEAVGPRLDQARRLCLRGGGQHRRWHGQ